MKKKFLAVLFAVLLASVMLLSACQGNVEQNKGRAINSVNHRGYSLEAPENTLSAYRLSKEKGFTMVECDITFTKDGVPVLLHDDSIDRTSTGSGAVRDLTFEEVRKYDFGSWKDSKYANEKIPTLDEFLDLCVELELYPYLEVKDGASEAEVALIAKAVLDHGFDAPTWIARDINILAQLVKIFPKGRFGLIVNIIGSKAVKQMKALANDTNEVFIDSFYKLVVGAQVNTCKKHGVGLELWTMDNEKEVWNVNPYVSGVTSDCINAQELFKAS